MKRITVLLSYKMVQNKAHRKGFIISYEPLGSLTAGNNLIT
jgi:hypothetical protein